MRITVFGATGGVGGEVVRQALEAGHEVTAVVRDPAARTTGPARWTRSRPCSRRRTSWWRRAATTLSLRSQVSLLSYAVSRVACGGDGQRTERTDG
ncbi:NmrA family NAD(P)-binding protein, partial [Streptomyces albidoflavus]